MLSTAGAAHAGIEAMEENEGQRSADGHTGGQNAEQNVLVLVTHKVRGAHKGDGGDEEDGRSPRAVTSETRKRGERSDTESQAEEGDLEPLIGPDGGAEDSERCESETREGAVHRARGAEQCADTIGVQPSPSHHLVRISVPRRGIRHLHAKD